MSENGKDYQQLSEFVFNLLAIYVKHRKLTHQNGRNRGSHVSQSRVPHPCRKFNVAKSESFLRHKSKCENVKDLKVSIVNFSKGTIINLETKCLVGWQIETNFSSCK